MQFYEKIGPVNFALVNRFLKKGDFSHYNFFNLFHAITSAEDLILFLSLAETHGCLEKNKAVLYSRLLQPLDDQKSAVIPLETFSSASHYLDLFPEFKTVLSHESVDFMAISDGIKNFHKFRAVPHPEIVFYNSMLRFLSPKAGTEIQDQTLSFLNQAVETRVPLGEFELLRKCVATLIFSSNPDIRIGVETFASQMIRERKIFDIEAGALTENVSTALTESILQALRADEADEHLKTLAFIENSLNDLEPTVFSGHLKAFFRQNHMDPYAMDWLMKVLFALNHKDTVSALGNVEAQMVESLKMDRKNFNQFTRAWKERVENQEAAAAEALLTSNSSEV